MPHIKKIALITGVQDEADAFLSDHQATVEETAFGSMRLIDYADKQIAVLCSGIGKVHAGAAAMHLNNRFQPDLFMVIGTAGQVSAIQGDCFYLQEALQADYGTLENSGSHDGFTHYNAGTWPIGPADWSPFQSYPLPDQLDFPKARIATADCFVKCPDRSSYLRETLKVDLVDMETAAVAQIANLVDTPWAGIKATTDNADGNSSGDFHANLAAAAGRAAKAAAQFIALL